MNIPLSILIRGQGGKKDRGLRILVPLPVFSCHPHSLSGKFLKINKPSPLPNAVYFLAFFLSHFSFLDSLHGYRILFPSLKMSKMLCTLPLPFPSPGTGLSLKSQLLGPSQT